MQLKHSILVGAATLLLAAGIASAQTYSAPNGAVNVTSTPSTTGVTPGQSGVAFGTVAISGNGGGTYSLTSLPVTVTPSSGASTSYLSNCQLFGQNGSALNNGTNVPGSIVSGSNTFTFDTPLSITSATTTLTVKCDVSGSAASGSTYQFIAGTPTFGSGLNLMVTTPASVAAGTNDAALALITLDATRSGQSINVSSVPVTLTFSGAAASEFSNCSLQNVANLGTPLNTGGNAVGSLNGDGTATSITLDTPLTVPAGSIQILALTCNIASVTPVGSSVMVSVTPGSVQASDPTTATTITPGTDTIAANGGVAPTYGTVEITAPGTGTTTTTGTPGTPNTGEGGEAPINLAILAISGALILLGGGMLVRSRLTRSA